MEEDFLRELVESTALADTSHRIWELAEPFQRVIRLRRKKLEQMNVLLQSAQKRISELESATDEVEMMERSELERQVAQLEEERNEILEIEKGIIEMETIYRNLLSLQETELKRKEDNLKLRLEIFQKEIVRRDKDKKRLLDWERSLKEKEEELAKKEGSLENQVEKVERRITEEVEARLAEGESGGSAEAQLSKLEEVPDPDLQRENEEKIESLGRRIGELEGEMDRIVKAKDVLEDQSRQLSDQNHEMKDVLKRLDALLGELPDNIVQEFAKSKDFEKYEKVLESCEG
jgi:chromosome segregation ATPase